SLGQTWIVLDHRGGRPRLTAITRVAPYHLKTFGENLREISKDFSSLASRLLPPTRAPAASSSSANKPAEALIQNTVSFEEGNECDVASARTNARGHPVRSNHQGSNEGGPCRSASAFSNAKGDSANVG